MTSTITSTLTPVVTPQGHLILRGAEDAVRLPDDLAQRLESTFARGSGHGLLHLGAAEVKTELPPALGYWRDFGARYVTALCMLPDVQSRAIPSVPPLEAQGYEALAAVAPPMTGVEYLSASVLETLWNELNAALEAELAESRSSLQDFLKRKNAAWNLVGRVHFNLAENRHDEEAPFAFLATYTTRLSSVAKAQHLPLGKAMSEYAGAANKSRLLSLLLPVQRAAEQCTWLREMVDTGEIYHPLRWTAKEAYQLLTDLTRLEAAGIIVRVPSTWRANRPPRARVTARVGGEKPSGLGQEALLDFDVRVTLDGEDAPLTKAEIARLLAGTDGLYFIRGRWIEVDRVKLREMLDRFQKIESIVADRGISFAEAARLLAGANVTEEVDEETAEWSRVTAGPWLAETLEKLRHPSALGLEPGTALKTTLRQYQTTGLQWLHLLSSLGLGACLADDMGLGKTMQVLALLLVLQRNNGKPRPSLLVAPASLLTNWVAEIARFAPDLNVVTAHPSAMKSEEMDTLNEERLANVDLVITSYGTLTRVHALVQTPWKLAILDEAQAIKNPGTRQSRVVKRLQSKARIALTGTPVENRVGDLWSIFDFLNPGLLGSAKDFTRFAKRLGERQHNPYGPLRDLVRPYILRRLKTDRSVIADLPDKTEVQAFCHLTRKQAALYQDAVDELSEALDRAERAEEAVIQRKGMILSFLMRFKQICNHPSQWLGDHDWKESDSGKFMRIREIAEVIGARQEKVLVFTQFREVTNPLADFLGKVFGRGGLVLHGETPVSQRQSLVDRFQEDESIPFFVISLRAGGFGLNLTAASHVIHFDRWWNPAVENQATDRAFRIGQTRNVLVHKFLCRGTVEEKIDALMESKRQLSEELFKGGAELLITEMKNDELLHLVSLDLRATSGAND